MSLEIKHATDLDYGSSTYLIYGQQGSGKTTSISYIPGKTLVIDIDHSSKVLKGKKNIDVVSVDSSSMWEEWIKTISELITNDSYAKTYDTIAVDNVSELFRACLENLGAKGKNDGVPSMADYQKVDYIILRSIRGLNQLPVRKVFTAWEKTDLWTAESGQQFNRRYPDLRQTISDNFMGLCDVIAYLTSSTDDAGNIKRGFILQPSNSITAKNRLDDRAGCLVDELVKDV